MIKMKIRNEIEGNIMETYTAKISLLDTVGFEVLVESTKIIDLSTRHPLIMFRTVANPFYEVLPPTTSSMSIENVVYIVLLAAISSHNRTRFLVLSAGE